MGSGNACREVTVAIGAAGPTPLRATSAEQYLKGKTLDDDVIMEAAERAVEGVSPASDVHGSREYRLEMIKVLTRRSLKLALSRVK
jgi:carbon-monoxide dehydrogenase medium subunit